MKLIKTRAVQYFSHVHYAKSTIIFSAWISFPSPDFLSSLGYKSYKLAQWFSV